MYNIGRAWKENQNIKFYGTLYLVSKLGILINPSLGLKKLVSEVVSVFTYS